jgi:hypothetical protein
MADPQLHVDDVGTTLLFPVTDEDGAVVPLGSYQSLTVYIARPDKSLLTRSGSLYTDGSDGIVMYQTVAGDFNTTGNYRFQAVVRLPSGLWHTEITSKLVKPNLGS